MLSLIVYFDFHASHSLDDYEVPHSHLWKFTLALSGNAIRGRIVDLPLLKSRIDGLLAPLNNCYLNQTPILSEQARAFPTCETLVSCIAKKIDEQIFEDLRRLNPSLKLLSLKLDICEPTGEPLGAALLQTNR